MPMISCAGSFFIFGMGVVNHVPQPVTRRPKYLLHYDSRSGASVLDSVTYIEEGEANAVAYFTSVNGRATVCAFPYEPDKHFDMRKPGDSFWLVPGTVDPLED